MDIKQLEQLYLTRQSCRKFSDKPVENEKLEKIIELTRLAPSATNEQPWSFEVVNNENLSREVAKAAQDMGMNRFAAKAPAFIVIVEEKASLIANFGIKLKDQDFVSNDLGIATAYMTLAATSLGLSTCILGWINEKKLQEMFSINKSKRVRIIIAVGYAEECSKIREKKRKPIEKIARFHF